MTMIEAIAAVLQASDPAGDPGYSGEFTLAGRLLSRGQIAVSGLDGAEFYTFDTVGDGLHEVYLAYDRHDGRGATVSAVALIASGTTPQALTEASWEEASDDVNMLSEDASVIYSHTPDNLAIGHALHRTPGFAQAEDPVAHAVAELEAQQEAGSLLPVLDIVVDPAGGANALVFPTCDFTAGSILIGRDETGTGVGIFWSNFDG
ncbi:hypothetical protein GCM10010441_20090 [Kitasatospora paracochleata]|uniref:Uncharacterized protein n=1 Tax=Kitasatospora paracochleata TaxID=58354 RepID=A0ABT1J848_9ACTN|nr:hypothetical protein [Kitasatospora paracochleata]MCP2313611.1 hypothetical protein [Kitasatospora paracochleata]